jgi:hypothetical protein
MKHEYGALLKWHLEEKIEIPQQKPLPLLPSTKNPSWTDLGLKLISAVIGQRLGSSGEHACIKTHTLRPNNIINSVDLKN